MSNRSRQMVDLTNSEQALFDEAYVDILEQAEDARRDDETDGGGALAARKVHDQQYALLLKRFNLEP